MLPVTLRAAPRAVPQAVPAVASPRTARTTAVRSHFPRIRRKRGTKKFKCKILYNLCKDTLFFVFSLPILFIFIFIDTYEHNKA